MFVNSAVKLVEVFPRVLKRVQHLCKDGVKIAYGPAQPGLRLDTFHAAIIDFYQ